MKSSLAVSCHGARSRWPQQHHTQSAGRLGRRRIVTSLLLALGLAVLALLVAEPVAAHVACMAIFPPA
ncbi:hypothetical protein HLY00_607 [Mycolicibacterium hippocampi]|uniref:Uncharacterized protein n=1 Tax=Mycolicibacterium hippocampi TaxID=659824 RepID=A0A850PEV6_9MYCO|nr:hypothetical protein [Mycolicibacterium hippocampi]